MSVIIRRVTSVISWYLGPKYIQLPTGDKEVQNLASNFYTRHGFLPCIGAVDGTQSLENHTDYISSRIGRIV